MKTILFIAHHAGWCYTRSIEAFLMEPAMTATRPSSLLMTTFVLAAAALFVLAASPILSLATTVVA